MKAALLLFALITAPVVWLMAKYTIEYFQPYKKGR